MSVLGALLAYRGSMSLVSPTVSCRSCARTTADPSSTLGSVQLSNIIICFLHCNSLSITNRFARYHPGTSCVNMSQSSVLHMDWLCQRNNVERFFKIVAQPPSTLTLNMMKRNKVVSCVLRLILYAILPCDKLLLH